MYTTELYHKIPQEFANDARVWIYQSNRAFNSKEIIEVEEQLNQFYQQWLSHGSPVKGWAGVLYNQFIVLMADENTTQVSGCSTDSMVRVIKSIERQYQLQLFDRMTISFLIKDKVEMLPLQQLKYAIENKYIDSATLLFDNTVSNKEELLKEWIKPLKESWLHSKI